MKHCNQKRSIAASRDDSALTDLVEEITTLCIFKDNPNTGSSFAFRPVQESQNIQMSQNFVKLHFFQYFLLVRSYIAFRGNANDLDGNGSMQCIFGRIIARAKVNSVDRTQPTC